MPPKNLVALAMTVSVIGCGRGSHEELNVWDITEAEFLLRSVIDAARKIEISFVVRREIYEAEGMIDARGVRLTECVKALVG